LENYKNHLKKRLRQNELNSLVDSSRTASNEMWSYFQSLMEEELIFTRNHDGKILKVFLVRKSDNISLEEIRKIKKMIETDEAICFSRDWIYYEDNGFTKCYKA